MVLKNQEAIAAVKLAQLFAFLPEGSYGETKSGDHTILYLLTYYVYVDGLSKKLLSYKLEGSKLRR